MLRPLLKDPLSAMLLVASIALAILFFSLLGSIQPGSAGKAVPLSAVTQLANAREISSAELLDHDHRVLLTIGPSPTAGLAAAGATSHAARVAARQAAAALVALQLTPGEQVYANYPASDAQTAKILQILQVGGATVTVDQQAGKPEKQIVVQFLLPIVLLVCLFAFFTRFGADGGSGGFAAFSEFTGKGRRRKKGALGGTTFADVAGAGEAVTELREIRDYLADPGKYARMGARAPKGVLLVGPPGTGKTLLARATAGEADAAFFSLSGAEFVESLVGVGAARVRDLFRKARKMAPAIVFIDELDAAGRKRGAGVGQGNDEREQTLNQLLVELDGFGGEAGVVVMAATNRPDILDPALLRPGRFDRQVTIDVPDVHGRVEILQLYLKGRPLDPEVDVAQVARLCPGFSGAELANLVNEAALLTVREGSAGAINQAQLEEAIDRVVAGPARKSHVLSEDERWIIAVHEASHAVVSRAIGQTVSAQKLSIVARGRQLGTAAHMLSDRDQVLQRQPDLERHLMTILAGAAGERIAFGSLSTGVSDDLHAATSLARSMVVSFGMSDALGPVTIGEKPGEVFLGASLQELGSVGPATLELIDREVERISGEAEARAATVLGRNWPAVEETANALLVQETLSGVALDAVLSTVVPMALEELDVSQRRPPHGGTDTRGGG